MSNKGEKTRKLKLITSGYGVRPPKVWFNKLKKIVSKRYPKFGKKRLGHIVGGIWAKMSIMNKKKLVKKYQR